MKSPFFTVLIPTYNRASLLCTAIRSVLDQTFSDFELIVVDDHSVDDIEKVVRSFNDKRIKYTLNDHRKGGSGTRNAGIWRARGQWIAFLDDDDIWLPQKLELQYEKIKEIEDDVGLVYTGFAFYDFKRKKELSVYTPSKEGWVNKDILYKNYIGTFSTVAIRTDLLKSIGGLDELFDSMQDAELYVRITHLAKVVYIKETLAYIRLAHKDRITTNYQKRLSGILLFSNKHNKLINKNLRLKHRIASRIFLFASLCGMKKYALRSLPWTAAGLFIDIHNVYWLSRRIISHIYRRSFLNKSLS